jgi:hypothetical protein
VIEIKHHQRDTLSVPPTPPQGLAQAVVQRDPVWQPGQAIMASQAVDILKGRNPVTDVLDQGKNRQLSAVLEAER